MFILGVIYFVGVKFFCFFLGEYFISILIKLKLLVKLMGNLLLVLFMFGFVLFWRRNFVIVMLLVCMLWWSEVFFFLFFMFILVLRLINIWMYFKFLFLISWWNVGLFLLFFVFINSFGFMLGCFKNWYILDGLLFLIMLWKIRLCGNFILWFMIFVMVVWFGIKKVFYFWIVVMIYSVFLF